MLYSLPINQCQYFSLLAETQSKTAWIFRREKTMTRHNELDRIDLRILTVLQDNGRITNQALSDQVALSPSPCLQRVKRLEKLGIIKGYACRIDMERIAQSITVFVTASLSSHEKGAFQAFEAVIEDIPELVECHKVSGQFDYLLRFVCSDIATYTAISDRLLAVGPDGLNLSSHVVLQTPKETRSFAIERLVGGR
jgi:DNA-binding Lrp family transcriptional regulator